MAAPGLEFCFTDRAGGTGGSLVVPGQTGGEVDTLDSHHVWGWSWSWSWPSCPDHPTHVTLQGGLSLSLSLSAAVITVSTLIMTFSDITDNILLISVTAPLLH